MSQDSNLQSFWCSRVKFLSWSSMNSLSFTKTSLDRSDRSSYFEYYSCVEGMEVLIKGDDPFHLVSVTEMEDQERSLWGRGGGS